MAAEYCRKSGQIPAFGDWENANELPITQYFECARQAGLLRCSCCRECGGSYVSNAASWGGGGGSGGVLYGVGSEKSLPRRVHAVPQRKIRGLNKGCQNVKEKMKPVTVGDLMDQPRSQPLAQKNYSKHSNKSGNFISKQFSHSVKQVDEDLYEIPTELLENSKRKKLLGFFSRCMVPPCAA